MANDWAIRKDFRKNHVGTECANAMNSSVFSTTNINDAEWDNIVSDFGGQLYTRALGGAEAEVYSELVRFTLACVTPCADACLAYYLSNGFIPRLNAAGARRRGRHT